MIQSYMEVEIIKRGIDGEKLCFLVEDSDGKQYEITNCDLKSIQNLDSYELYCGSFLDENGRNHIAHLEINKISHRNCLELSE